MADSISPTALPIANLQNLAPAIFGSEPNNALAAPDIYTIDASAPAIAAINTPQGKYSSFASNLGSSITSMLGGGSSSELSKLTTFARSGAVASLMRGNLNLTSSNVVGRLTSLGGQVSNLVPGLSSTLSQSVNLTRGQWNSIASTVGNITTQITSGEPMGITQTMDMINRVTGNSTLANYLDLGPIASTLTTVTSQLLRYGVPQMIDQVMSQISSDDVKKQAYQTNALAVLQSGDLTSIQSMMNSLGIGPLLTKVPNAALIVIESFRIPSGTATTAYPDQATTLTGILTTLDATWASTTRNGADIASLEYFGAASADALKVLKTDPTYLVQATIGNTYKSEATLATLSKDFPAMLKL